MKYIILFCIIVVLFAGCSHEGSDNKGKTVFRYNEAANITSLDPAYARDQANIWATHQIFNGLVQLDEHLEIIPCIARAWTISGDGMIYTFHLRRDVYFHDNPVFPGGKGRRVVAADFKYSFTRITGSVQGSPGEWIFTNVLEKDGNYSFSASDDSTFVIQLKNSFPPFLGLLTTVYCSAVPPEAIRFYGEDFRKNPVGTGPFQFKMWKEGVKLVLVKNPHYFESENGEKLPFLDAVAITFLSDKQSAFLEFIKGNLDFMSGIDPSYKDELLTPDGGLNPKFKNRIRLISQPYLNTEYLGILVDTNSPVLKNSPLKQKLVREAINYAFDRKKMVRFLRNNIGTPGVNGIVPKGMPSFDSSRIYYDFDPDKSRKLLSVAGYPNGLGLPPVTLTTTSDYLDICKYIQHQVSEIGINMSIDITPPAALKEMKAQARVPFFRASWIADYPDAESYLSMFLTRNFCPGGPNYTHFSDNLYDQLYDKAMITLNDSARFSYYRRMEDRIMEDSPVVILYYDQVLRFTNNNVEGLGSDPMNMLTLKRVRKTSR